MKKNNTKKIARLDWREIYLGKKLKNIFSPEFRTLLAVFGEENVRISINCRKREPQSSSTKSLPASGSYKKWVYMWKRIFTFTWTRLHFREKRFIIYTRHIFTHRPFGEFEEKIFNLRSTNISRTDQSYKKKGPRSNMIPVQRRICIINTRN